MVPVFSLSARSHPVPSSKDGKEEAEERESKRMGAFLFEKGTRVRHG